MDPKDLMAVDDDVETDDNMSGIEAVDDENDSDYDVEQDRLAIIKEKKNKRASGKWKIYYDNKCFKKEWLDLFPWVEEHPMDPKLAICRACNTKIKAHKGILETHQKTKRHIKNISGSDEVDEEEESIQTQKSIKPEPKLPTATPQHPAVEQLLTDDQIGFFTESAIDAAHQAITSLIDKLVEKYHENRLENLRVQNEAVKQLSVERSTMVRSENQRKLERRMQQEAYSQEAAEMELKFLQQQHEMKINAMENERDAKLKAVEQQLMFARQEYEKKVKLLDQQLQYIK